MSQTFKYINPEIKMRQNLLQMVCICEDNLSCKMGKCVNAEALNLVKYVIENGFDRDPKVMALLCSFARNPDSEHREALLRLISPKALENMLMGNPFLPYPAQDEFQGEIEIGLVGIHEPYKLEVFKIAGSVQTSNSNVQEGPVD